MTRPARIPACSVALCAVSACAGLPAQAPVDPKRFRVTYEDVAGELGLTSPTVYGGQTQNEYILESTGSGAAFLDYDQDGLLDIFLVNGTTLDGGQNPAPTNRLLRNNGGLGFRDVTLRAGLARSGWGQGVCAGDFDNNGFEDLFVTYWGQDVLYRNNGDGTFTDVTRKAGLEVEEPSWGSGCAFLDFDRDGLLDLFHANYIDFDPQEVPSPVAGNCVYKGLKIACGPKGLPKAGRTLFRNQGDGRFVDVSELTGIGQAPRSYGLGVLTADFDADGWIDIYVANDGEPSHLFWNDADGTFSEAGLIAGVATSHDGRTQSGMGVAAGDFDRDGRLDIFKTNFSDDLPNLYRNLGGRFFDEATTRAGLGVNSRMLGWGCGFFDADNDGWVEILYVNGHVYPEIDRLESPVGYRQPKVLYHNLGNGRFADVSRLGGEAIVRSLAARGAAFGDFDNDGDIDILVNPINDLPQLLRCNSASGNHWTMIKLRGSRSNRSAIGARVICVTGDDRQVREVRSGGSYYSQNDLRVHFGVGEATVVDLLEIQWPSGRTDRFTDLSVDRILTIEEHPGSGAGTSELRSARQ